MANTPITRTPFYTVGYQHNADRHLATFGHFATEEEAHARADELDELYPSLVIQVWRYEPVANSQQQEGQP